MNDAHKVASDLAYAAKIFDGSGEMVLKELGMILKPEVEAAVRRTPVKDTKRSLRDASMSGWGGFAIVGRFDIKSDNTLEITPERKMRGPMRVLEDGRKAYQAGDMRKSGSYVSKKTGIRKDKTRRVKGRVGATRGKGTWTRAETAMERESVEAFPKAVDRVAVKARLGRG